MNPGLQPGQTGELHWFVDPSLTITLGGLPQATVFSTPSMIMLMERAAREALRPFLEPGEESVGVEVQVEHLAPAPLGSAVRGAATVTAVEGRNVSFDLAAFHGETQIGRGRHRRAVVQLERLVQNIAKAGAIEGGTLHLKPNSGDLPRLETLAVELSGRVATVTLKRPESLNAVDVRMTGEWEQFLAWLAGHPDDPRVVIVTGAGRAFCAGDDVKEVEALAPDGARALSLRQARLYLAFESMPQPFIAAVNGAALGAGCVCACSCDLRIAAHGAEFGMPEIRLGWPPGYGVAQLTALVGKARALELCLTGRTINAREALEWSLVNELTSGYLLLKRAHQLAAQLLKLPPLALRETKRLVHLDEGNLPKVAHHLDTEAYLRCLQTADAREGIAAFKEKRTGRFRGR